MNGSWQSRAALALLAGLAVLSGCGAITLGPQEPDEPAVPQRPLPARLVRGDAGAASSREAVADTGAMPFTAGDGGRALAHD